LVLAAPESPDPDYPIAVSLPAAALHR
jgi:hypothetical protein